MVLPHFTLDNTNVLTVENIYISKQLTSFFLSWKTKCTSRIFRKSSCMTVTEASVPSPVVPSQSLQCNQTSSQTAWVAVFGF